MERKNKPKQSQLFSRGHCPRLHFGVVHRQICHESVPDGIVCLRLGGSGFGYFDHVDMRWAEHVGAENNPFAVGRELAVRLKRVIMLGQVNEFFSFEIAATYQSIRVAGAAGNRQNHVRMEKVNPLAVIGCGHASGAAAVAAKELLVGRDIEMHRPLVFLQVVPCPLLAFDFVAADPENMASRRLQIVNNTLSVRAEELVAVDLIVHNTRLDVGQSAAVGADYPGPVHKLPGALVTKEHLIRIGRGKLHVVQPCVAFVEFIHPAGFQIDSDKLHVTIFVRGAETRSAAAAPAAEPLRRIQIECSARQRLIAIDIRDRKSAGDIDDFPVFFGGRVNGPDSESLITSRQIEGPARFATNAYQPGPFISNLFYLAALEVNRVKPARCSEDQLSAVGSKFVLVEIRAPAAVLTRKPDDSMSRIGIDPVGRNICLGMDIDARNE
jgi:hypothetical protein